uniref:Uncharacterized protein n=1 Tax=Myoviridae sp. ct1IL4 TaxID=2825019 RepID=A0A8S5Q823_9CAUD|nr:MAG TPA: hypothetical protein [Myoviridae sp. ct1IL4]
MLLYIHSLLRVIHFFLYLLYYQSILIHYFLTLNLYQ